MLSLGKDTTLSCCQRWIMFSYPLFFGVNFYMNFRLLWGISAAFEAEVRVQNHLVTDGSFFI